MPKRNTRLLILGSVMGAALLLLAGRLWWLQLTRWSEYNAKALGNRTLVAYKCAPRGLFCDRRGSVLAENREVWTASLVPAELPRDKALLEKEAQFLASVLSSPDSPMSLPDVRKALGEARHANAVEPVPLGNIGQDLTFDQVAAIEEHRLEFPGLVVVTSTRRHYPRGALAAHVIGYTRPVDAEHFERLKALRFPPDPEDPTTAELTQTASDSIYLADSTIGAEGLEEAEELYTPDVPGAQPLPVLTGRRGRTVYEVDAAGAPQRSIAERQPVPGARVDLTLDAQAQYVAERALTGVIAGRSDGMSAAVVMDVRTGDVLVMADEPCLDPNDWVSGLSREQWAVARESKGLPLLNKALRAYPPGSVFKVVSTCAALETTNVRPSTTAYCTGKITVGRRHETFRCWTSDRGGHGAVDLLEAIARSCNIFFYDTVLRYNLDPRDIARYADRFGLGKTTGLGLRGEVAGEVPDPEYTGRPWRQGNSLNFVIGQDRLTATPLQMCVACAALANHGTLLKPNLVKRIHWPRYLHRDDTVHNLADARPLNVRPESVEIVRRGMRLAVIGDHGTCKGMSVLAISSAGKTGSAQYRPGESTHAWFIGFAPYEDPQYAICVFVGGGGHGADVAVPVALKVFRALFGLYEQNDPDFTLPPPMDPATIAAQRHDRIAAARAMVGPPEAQNSAAQKAAPQ